MVCVSVILPTFNRVHSLDRAIRSVLDQSFADLELIVVDDCSSDGTDDFVRSISDRRLRYIKRAINGGAAASRNTGIVAATGEFIAFQDSDDVWLPGKLNLQLNLIRTAPDNVGVVTGVKLLWDGKSAQVAVAPDPAKAMSLGQDQYAHLLMENRISVQNALFRREIFPTDDWFDKRARANEDWDMAVRLSRRWKVLEHIDPVVVAYRSPDSISSMRRREGMGLLRIIKNNADMRAGYSRAFAWLDYRLGRTLWGPGKYRSGLKFMTKGVAAHPLILWSILSGKLHRAFMLR